MTNHRTVLISTATAAIFSALSVFDCVAHAAETPETVLIRQTLGLERSGWLRAAPSYL